MGRLRSAALAAATVAVLAAPPSAAASPSSSPPPERPGPVLSVAPGTLQNALRCTGDLADAPGEPVLLVPPTLADPDEAYFGYQRAFAQRGMAFCTIAIPHRTSIDIQTTAEYVVYAIRRMSAARHGGKVDVLGLSQGAGPSPRWALRFWPDVRHLVDDQVGLAPPNRGAPLANAICAAGCVPALRQQAAGSAFIAALNAPAEAFPGIDYTVIYSRTDGLVVPGDAPLRPAPGTQVSNVAVQDVCPADLTTHIGFVTANTAFALVFDALTHAGPAAPSRVDRSTCDTATMPTMSSGEGLLAFTSLTAEIFGTRLLGEPQSPSEPALRCYASAGCAQRTRLRVDIAPRRLPVGRATAVRVTVTRVGSAGTREPALGVVRYARRSAELDDAGTARVRVGASTRPVRLRVEVLGEPPTTRTLPRRSRS